MTARLAFELGSKRAGSRVTPAAAQVRKVVFRIGGSIPFTERDVSPTREHRFCTQVLRTSPTGRVSCGSLVEQSSFPTDVLRRWEHPFWRKWAFPVHGSTVSAGRRALHFQGCKTDVLLAWEPILFGRRLAFELGCPPGRGKGGSRVTPGGVKDWKVVFCVGGSAPAESCSGSVHSGRLGSGRNPRAKTRIPK